MSFGRLARIRPDKDEAYERISVASRFDLKVVGDRFPFPICASSVRTTPARCTGSTLKLPLATTDPMAWARRRRPVSILFARPQDHDRLRRVLDSQEITARIFAL